VPAAVAIRRRTGPALVAAAVGPVLRADRAVAAIVAGSVALRLAVVVGWWLGVRALPLSHEDPDTLLVAAIWIGLSAAWTAIGAFAKLALLTALDGRLHGRPRGLRRCLARAFARTRAVAGWTVVQLRHQHASWTPEAAFALPLLATAEVADLDAAGRRSAEAFRARWGDAAEVGCGAPAAIGFGTVAVAGVPGLAGLSLPGAIGTLGVALALVVLVAGLTAATLARAVIALAAYRRTLGDAAPLGLGEAELRALVHPR
jgi:hypothetical protein